MCKKKSNFIMLKLPTNTVMNKKEKIKKIAIITILFITGCLLVLLLRPNYFINILIVYFPATFLTLYWAKKTRWKIFIFALIATLLFAIPVEIIARLANAWDVQSIFPRIAGIAPIENLIYAFINFLWPIAFYENFIDKDSGRKISKKIKYLIWIFITLSISTYSLFLINKDLITWDYWKIGLFALIIPAILIFKNNPKLLKKTILTTIFFALIFFTHELVSMYVGHWWWPGEYLLTFDVFGKIFPVDDIIIWYILSTPVLIGNYEFFADDFK